MQCTARVANWMFVIRFFNFVFVFFSLFLLTLSLSLSDCRLMLSKLAIGISYANRVPRAKPSRSIDSQTVRRRQSDRETDWLTNLSASSVHPSRSLERGWARAFQGGRFGQSPSTSASTSDDNKHGLRNLWTLSSYSIYTIYDLQPYGKIANARHDDDKEELKIRSYKSSVWVKKSTRCVRHGKWEGNARRTLGLSGLSMNKW